MKIVEKFLIEYKTTVSFFLTLFGLAIAFFTFDNYISNKIDDSITTPEYISKVSKTLRPFLILDNTGNVTYDHGATMHIDSVIFHYYDKEEKDFIRNWPESITVFAKSYMNHAPLLDYIGAYNFTYEVSRSKNHSWNYSINPIFQLWSELGAKFNKEHSTNIYILEILN